MYVLGQDREQMGDKSNISLLFWLFISVVQLCLTLCNPMNCSMSGFPVLHYFLEFAQTPVH